MATVTVRNLVAASENKIHDDATAKGLGLAGGLVAGADIYGHLVKPAIEVWGVAFLSRGYSEVRFEQPLFDGDEVSIDEGRDDDAAHPTMTVAANKGGKTCATLRATLAELTDDAIPDVPDWTVAPLPDPADRPAASAASMPAGHVMGTWEFQAEDTASYLADLDDNTPIYREGNVAHPGWILRQANHAFAANYALGPWLHASSRIQNFQVIREGDGVAVLGRVGDHFEKGGHKFVTLDQLFVVAGVMPVALVHHTCIYEPGPLG